MPPRAAASRSITPQQVDAWLAGITSDNTRHAYRRDLVVFVEWLDDAGIAGRPVTPNDVVDFRAACEGAGSSAATVRRRLAAVSSFYRSLGGRASANPVAAVERPRRSSVDVGVGGTGDADGRSDGAAADVLDEADIDALWSAACSVGGKTAVLLALLLFDGFTTPRALKVDVADLQLTAGRMMLDDEGVLSALDERTVVAVRGYLGSRRAGPLLLGDRTVGAPERLTRFGVDYLVKQAARRAGLDGGLTVTTVRRSVARAAVGPAR